VAALWQLSYLVWRSQVSRLCLLVGRINRAWVMPYRLLESAGLHALRYTLLAWRFDLNRWLFDHFRCILLDWSFGLLGRRRLFNRKLDLFDITLSPSPVRYLLFVNELNSIEEGVQVLFGFCGLRQGFRNLHLKEDSLWRVLHFHELQLCFQLLSHVEQNHHTFENLIIFKPNHLARVMDTQIVECKPSSFLTVFMIVFTR